MPQQILRTSALSPTTVTFGTTAAASSLITMTTASAFAVYVGSGQPTTTITWYAGVTSEGPWAPVVLSTGSSATTSVTAGNVYIAPPELFPCFFVKGVAASAVTATLMVKG